MLLRAVNDNIFVKQKNIKCYIYLSGQDRKPYTFTVLLQKKLNTLIH